jgi:GntR family transcriptional regulator
MPLPLLASAPTDFDFVVGDWLVTHRRLKERLAGCTEWIEFDGEMSTRKILGFGFVTAPARVRRVLGVRRVLEVRRLTLADGKPFARVTVWCAEHLGRHLSLDDVERSTFYELLDVELGGATQTITAAAASATDAPLLELSPGSPVLWCERVTADEHGQPVLLSEHVFPSRRTQFVVELARADRSMAPSGLRLVE